METIRVQGSSKLPADRIIAASGLKIGQAVDKAEFDGARERLLATGGFESVGYTYTPSKPGTGFDAVIEVIEATPLFPFRFEELGASDKDLRAQMAKNEPLFGEQIPATPAVLERIGRILTGYLEGKSPGSKHPVEGRLRSDLAGEPTILFRPPGDRPRIAEVRFLGNEAVETARLANTLAEVAIGTPFTDPNVRLLLDSSIRRLYEARGRIRVGFPKIEGVPSQRPDVNGIALTVTVEEGPEYKLGTVKYIGVAQKQLSEIEKLANFTANGTANFDEIDSGLLRITKRYKAAGYLKASTKIDRTIHDNAKTVDLVITLTPGPQYVYGTLVIQGLDLLSEPAVRKYWGERAGKPFDPDAPDAFLKNIRDERMFDNLGETTAAIKVNEDTRTADVTLTFKGAPPAGRKTQGF